MSAVPTSKGRERQSASQAPTRHSDAGPNPPTSSFRTPRSGDPESSSLLNRTTTAETVSAQCGKAWPLVPIHSITHHRSGNSKLIKGKLSDKPNDNLYPAFSASGQDVWHTDYEHEGDAIVVSAVGARCGKCFLAGGKWSAIANTHVVWPDPGKVAIKFLWYLLNDEKFWIRSGTAQPFVAVRKTFEKEIHLPPLPVQREIVAEIEKQFTRLDAGMAALRRVQANLKRYRAAALKTACEGRLVPTEAELAKAEDRTYETGEQLLARILADRRKNWHGRGKYKEPAAPETTNLQSLPEGWVWATMPQLGELGRGKSKHRPRDDAKLYGGPYPFIQTGDVRRSNGTVRDYTQTYSEFGLQQSRLWPAGTLCITIAANIAETGILKFDACFPDSVVGFVQDVGPSTARYVEFFIRTTREKLEQYAPATAQKNINLDVLQKVAIPLPPLAEQARIVAEVERRLSIIEELEAAVAANLQRATRLRQSVLRRAFE